MSSQQKQPPTAARKNSRRAWLAGVYVALLIAAKVLWATTAYYEWIPLGLAGAILVFAYFIRPREHKDRAEMRSDKGSGEV
jgi:Flp pilus assembly protein TadB